MTLRPKLLQCCTLFYTEIPLFAGVRQVDPAVLPVRRLHRHGRHLLHRLHLQSRRHQHGQVSYLH